MPKGRKPDVNLAIKEAQIRFLESFQSNFGNVSQTCKQLGVDRRTYYNWLKYEAFERLIEMVRTNIKQKFLVEIALPMYHQKIAEGNIRLLERMLDANGIDVTNTNKSNEASVDFIAQIIETADLSDNTDEDEDYLDYIDEYIKEDE